MPYRIPDCPGPGLSRDTTPTVQTSGYYQVHCSITSDPFFITALCFYHGKNCQQKHQKGGRFKIVSLTLPRLGGFPAEYLKLQEKLESPTDNSFKEYVTTTKALTVFFEDFVIVLIRTSCKKCFWRNWSQRGVNNWRSAEWKWCLVTGQDMEIQEFGTAFTWKTKVLRASSVQCAGQILPWPKSGATNF